MKIRIVPPLVVAFGFCAAPAWTYDEDAKDKSEHDATQWIPGRR